MWTVFISGCVSFSLVMSLALCLCWKKKTPKNELLGLDGMVIQKNPDENVNHLPSAAPCVVAVNADCETNDKRNVPVTNTRRSLPDIPSEQAHWEPSGDSSSEHYATVGQFANANKRHTLHNGVEAKASASQHSSINQTDNASSPYEKVKYDQIKSKEHPYAQLQPTTSRAGLQESKVEERISLLRPDVASTSEPSAPPRSRRSSAQSTLGVDIPAASAVAGGIAASPDLPYMTPPINQSNFSGDSQDSSKGYTSITVREPLANLLAQTKEMNKKRDRDSDQHYSTVSDDSDDVYTTIHDPNQIYTSESETYARIPAHPITVEAEVNAPAEGSGYEAAPQLPPPSVNSLKQVAGHSRQASSSSLIASIGSPKPEKRQANSPLPPPPPSDSYRTLDDLYAKVHKTKKKEESDGEKTPRNSDVNVNFNIASPNNSKAYEPSEHNYETLRGTIRDCSDPGYEKIPSEEPGYATINGPESITSSNVRYKVDPFFNYKDKSEEKSSSFSNSLSMDEPNYESMPSESLSSEPNYAAVKSGSESDPNYESVRDLEEPPYEKVNEKGGRGYENIDTSESSNGTRSGPPYEQLNDTDSELPGYEKIRKNASSGAESTSGSEKGTLHEEDAIFQV